MKTKLKNVLLSLCTLIASAAQADLVEGQYTPSTYDFYGSIISIKKFGHGYILSSGSVDTYVEENQVGRLVTVGDDYLLKYRVHVHPAAETVCSERSAKAPCNVYYTDSYETSCKKAGGWIELTPSEGKIFVRGQVPYLHRWSNYHGGSPCYLANDFKNIKIVLTLKK